MFHGVSQNKFCAINKLSEECNVKFNVVVVGNHYLHDALILTFMITFNRSLTRQNLVDYISIHYKAPRIVLAGAGGVDHHALVKLAEQHFTGLTPNFEGVPPKMEACRFTGIFERFLI